MGFRMDQNRRKPINKARRQPPYSPLYVELNKLFDEPTEPLKKLKNLDHNHSSTI
jgi:hypothetical protein